MGLRNKGSYLRKLRGASRKSGMRPTKAPQIGARATRSKVEGVRWEKIEG